jgi:hypothetical protein
MTYYDGISENDKPINGGKWVNENSSAHESHNFSVITFDDNEKKYCLGYVQTKSDKINLKRIHGCKAVNDDYQAEGIIVVWCATPKDGQRRVIGWYKNATVLQNWNYIYIKYEECDEEKEQDYYFKADEKDCVLLPENERALSKWYVPTNKYNKYHFGFGQDNVWYGKISKDTKKAYSKDELDLYQTKLDEYLETLIENIENYDGENWLDDFN